MNTVSPAARPVAGPDAPAARPGRYARGATAMMAGLAVMAAGLVAGVALPDRAGLSPVGTAQAAEPADPSTFGRDLAGSCSGCHNTAGRAIGDGAVLAGMPADRMIKAMSDFREGRRAATVMHQISKGYTPEQVRLLAEYFAAQSPK